MICEHVFVLRVAFVSENATKQMITSICEFSRCARLILFITSSRKRAMQHLTTLQPLICSLRQSMLTRKMRSAQFQDFFEIPVSQLSAAPTHSSKNVLSWSVF